MPKLQNPVHEARRLDAVKAALQAHKPWLRSTGPTTAAGRRKMAANGTQHGARSLALRLALTYCIAVSRALEQSVPWSLSGRSTTKKPSG